MSNAREKVPLGSLQLQEDVEDTDNASIRTSSSRCQTMFLHAWHNVVSRWKIIFFGQILSFLLACTGAAQATLALNCHLSAPTFTIGLFYFGLSFLLLPVYLSRRRQQSHQPESDNAEGRQQHASYTLLYFIPLQAPAWIYLCMAILDVYANYFTVLAFKYTTITSVTLFDALAIPSAMILSRLFLARTYTPTHLLGVLTCMLGILCNVLQDYEDDNIAYPHKLRGDLLSITGGILFGANDVLGEVAVRRLGGPNEYLGMLGFFATIICVIQTLWLEVDDVAAFFGRGSQSETCHRAASWWLLLIFTMANVVSYIGSARFLQISEATFLCLSFLTADLWSVAFSVIAERIVPKPLFFVALVFTVSGVILYEMAPTPVQEDRETLGQPHALAQEEEVVVSDNELSLELHENGHSS